jgi:hypothetical protein
VVVLVWLKSANRREGVFQVRSLFCIVGFCLRPLIQSISDPTMWTKNESSIRQFTLLDSDGECLVGDAMRRYTGVPKLPPMTLVTDQSVTDGDDVGKN